MNSWQFHHAKRQVVIFWWIVEQSWNSDFNSIYSWLIYILIDIDIDGSSWLNSQYQYINHERSTCQTTLRFFPEDSVNGLVSGTILQKKHPEFLGKSMVSYRFSYISWEHLWFLLGKSMVKPVFRFSQQVNNSNDCEYQSVPSGYDWQFAMENDNFNR